MLMLVLFHPLSSYLHPYHNNTHTILYIKPSCPSYKDFLKVPWRVWTCFYLRNFASVHSPYWNILSTNNFMVNLCTPFGIRTKFQCLREVFFDDTLLKRQSNHFLSSDLLHFFSTICCFICILQPFVAKYLSHNVKDC